MSTKDFIVGYMLGTMIWLVGFAGGYLIGSREAATGEK